MRHPKGERASSERRDKTHVTRFTGVKESQSRCYIKGLTKEKSDFDGIHLEQGRQKLTVMLYITCMLPITMYHMGSIHFRIR